MKEKKIAITIDLEDWFQVENLRSVFPLESWTIDLVRFHDPLNRLLELFDRYNIKATFFVLGWIAERFPEVIKELYQKGHEIASHGMTHRLNSQLEYHEIKTELVQSKGLLEGIINDEVIGYRAPSFTISDSLINCLREVGYKYDSSYFPYFKHKRYGQVSSKLLKNFEDKGFKEFSISLGNLMGREMPFAGGAYFRILPLWIIKKMLISKTNNKIVVMYFHPWEFDENQPKMKSIGISNRIKHYFGLGRNLIKIEKLFAFLRENKSNFLKLDEAYFIQDEFCGQRNNWRKYE